MAKKKQPGKYLKMYYTWMKTGRFLGPVSGLCDYFGTNDEFLQLMKPSKKEKAVLNTYLEASAYWGAETREECVYDLFGPFRQTVLLFMAAMNNEL